MSDHLITIKLVASFSLGPDISLLFTIIIIVIMYMYAKFTLLMLHVTCASVFNGKSLEDACVLYMYCTCKTSYY